MQMCFFKYLAIHLSLLVSSLCCHGQQKIFDVHLHGSNDPLAQTIKLTQAGVYKIAISTSWDLQQNYNKLDGLDVLRGLMVPCPNGKVPYSLQTCFTSGNDWPAIEWVEEQIKSGNIKFIGEVLSQYYGISPSDTLLLPYYRLAKKYDIPVGIHTGSAGPNHGCPNFKEELGDPQLMETFLRQVPGLKVWIMHAGAPFHQQAINVMKQFPQVYTDISAINNPAILSPEKFAAVIKLYIDNGLEDRIMFGSDNGEIKATINSISQLNFLTKEQKEKIFYRNAETFFK
jgi:uncharacterized protein